MSKYPVLLHEWKLNITAVGGPCTTTAVNEIIRSQARPVMYLVTSPLNPQYLFNHYFYFSDSLVYVQAAAATPVELLKGLTEVGSKNGVENVKLFHMHLEGEAPFVAKEYASTDFFLSFKKAVNCKLGGKLKLFVLSFVQKHLMR